MHANSLACPLKKGKKSLSYFFSLAKVHSRAEHNTCGLDTCVWLIKNKNKLDTIWHHMNHMVSRASPQAIMGLPLIPARPIGHLWFKRVIIELQTLVHTFLHKLK